jgi:hypothetical protein
MPNLLVFGEQLLNLYRWFSEQRKNGNICIVAVLLYCMLWKRRLEEMGRWFTRAEKCYISF